MSKTTNTTTPPAAPAAPAPETTAPAKSNAPASDFKDMVYSGLQNLGQQIEQAQHKQEAPKPAATADPAKPAEPVNTPDRRFKLTPQKAEDPKQEPAKAQEAPSAAAPEQSDPLEAIEPDKGVSEASKVNFGKLREAYKATKAERAAKERELSELKAQFEAIKAQKPVEPPTADYEAVKAQNKELSDRLAKVDYANSPEFLAKYKVPQDASLAEASEVLSYNDKKADLRGLLGKTPKEMNASLAEITRGMNPVDQATVINAVRSAAKLESGAQEALKNAKANIENQSQRSLYQSRTDFEATWQETGLGQYLQKQAVPADVNEDAKSFIDSYNKGIDSIKPAAEKYAFGQLSTKEVASVAQKAAMADFYLQHGIPAIERFLNSVAAERDTLAAENKALKSARSPGVPAGAPQTSTQSVRSTRYSPTGDSVQDMAETIQNIMRQKSE